MNLSLDKIEMYMRDNFFKYKVKIMIFKKKNSLVFFFINKEMEEIYNYKE